MDQLISVVNELHDILADAGQHTHEGLGLPQIVVVGSQSAGKSSVLEALVGKDFLPRGQGIVTRRPLIIKLCYTPLKVTPSIPSTTRRPSASVNSWGQFNHKPDDIFSDFSKIRDEIEAETNRHCKPGEISDDPISLQIFSPDVVDLTLVDLPGVTKFPMPGQSEEIHEKIRKLVINYISEDNSIILAVSPANVDLANSDSLDLARSVDPNGRRTVGVITKLDLMDRGTDAVKILRGDIYPLSLGYIGVVCRSYQDTEVGLGMEASKEAERRFFTEHRAYGVVSERCGRGKLATNLNRCLMAHIQKWLPIFTDKIQDKLEEADAQLRMYDQEPIADSDLASQQRYILGVFAKFSNDFAAAIEGKTSHSSLSPSNLSGGARINFIFHENLGPTIMNFNPFHSLSDKEIRMAIRNATGPRSPVFVPEVAFEQLVRQQILKLESPALQCVDQVFEELNRVVQLCDLPEMVRFSHLRDQIREVVRAVLKRCQIPTKQMVSNLIRCEVAYINTTHPDFIGGARAIAKVTRDSQGQQARQESDLPEAKDVGEALDGVTGKVHPTGAAASKLLNGESAKPQPAPPPVHLEDVNRTTSTMNTPDESKSRFFSIPWISRQSQEDVKPTESPVIVASPRKAVPNQEEGRHPRRGDGLRLNPLPESSLPESVPCKRQKVEIDIIKMLIHSYLEVVKKNVCDQVPKAIMHFMVNTSREVVQQELVSRLYKPEALPWLLQEDEEICRKRQEAMHMKSTVEKALGSLAKIKAFDVEKKSSGFPSKAEGSAMKYERKHSSYSLKPEDFSLTGARKSPRGGEQGERRRRESDPFGLVQSPNRAR